MDSRTIAYALYGWVATAVAVGSVLIVFGSTLPATVGTVVIIVGLVSLMPAFSYLWWESESDPVESAEAAEAVEAIEATEAVEAIEATEAAEAIEATEAAEATEATEAAEATEQEGAT